MKKTLYATLILIAVGLTANAQEARKGIAINNPAIDITGEMLTISMEVAASDLGIKCDGQTILEFAVESTDRRLVLPAIIYTGGERYHYERRRALLSDSYSMEPYEIHKVRKNRTYTTAYRIEIPYYSWMEHASISWREYTHDCSGENLSDSGLLVADLNPAPVYVEPEVWAPNPALFANLVGFLVPRVEDVKDRASMIELPIGFPVNVTEVRPDFGNNRYELSRADSLMTMLQGNELIDIRGVNIKGYASPEGKYSVNERLAKGRSHSFKQYLVNRYPDNAYIRNAHIEWEPEDWEGFGRLVEADNTVAQKQDVLSIVYDKSIGADAKDQMLQNIVWWSQNYKVILKEMYPKLRRIELSVNYTVKNLTDNKARELIYTDPGMLSLDEMFRVARYYEPGSKQYREVYEIAARQYPNDIVANNNAAAALLQEGNAEDALPYLEKTRGNDSSLINYGAYWYISGDLEKATEYFEKAKAAGIEQAEHNLRLISPGSAQ